MRLAAALLAALALLAAPAEARQPRLGKARAQQQVNTILGRNQVAYLFDVQLIHGWVVEPARACARLGPARVRCAFSVTRSNDQVCGGRMTIIRRRAEGDQPAYLGWIISVNAMDGPCDDRAAREAEAGLPRRSIRLGLERLHPLVDTADHVAERRR